MKRQSTVLAVAIFAAVTLGLMRVAAAGEAEEGFKSIFNGKDLTGWDGDPKLWSVKNGVIRGETTKESPAKHNTFLIWRGETLGDFELRLSFRIRTGNSGVQVRSRERGDWVVSGYQAEVAPSQKQMGLFYDERGRGALATAGQRVAINAKGEKKIVGMFGEPASIQKAFKENEWNDYDIIGRGNRLVQKINGVVFSEVSDDQAGVATTSGILALQIHMGPPMVVEFKDIRLKNLAADYGDAHILFSGKDLSGWVPSSDALKDTFAAKDGVLVDGGRPAGYLRTTEDFTNFCLWLQVRHTKPGNGGILVRMTGPDKVWPKSIECQGQSGALGDIWNIDQFPMKAAEDRTSGRHTKKLHPSNEKPIGQWNRYEITLDGGDLELAVNGLVQNAATGCEEVPGKIGLQAEGGVMEYRNIVLIPILRGGAAPAGGEQR